MPIRLSHFILITFLATISHVLTDLYIPSMPAITQDFATSNTLIQFTLSAYLISSAISQLIYGPLSDHFGRRPMLINGFCLTLFGTLICCLAPSAYWLIGGRFIQGIGMGTASVSRSILPDLCSGRKLAQYNAYLSMSIPLFLLISPILGGYIEYYLQWRFTFIAALCYLIVLLCLIYRNLPETNQTLKQQPLHFKQALKNYATLLINPSFMGYSFCAALCWAGILSYLNVSPFLLQNMLGLSSIEYGYLIIVICGGVFMGGILNSRLLRHFSAKQVVCIGAAIQLLAGISLLVCSLWQSMSVLNIMAPTFLFCLGVNLTLGNAFVCAVDLFRTQLGTASALFGSLQVLGGSLGSAIIALCPEASSIPLAISYCITGFAAFLIAVYPLCRKTPT